MMNYQFLAISKMCSMLHFLTALVHKPLGLKQCRLSHNAASFGPRRKYSKQTVIKTRLSTPV